MIPPKVVLEGDRSRGERLRGLAQSQLEILHNTLKFQGLKQGTRTVTTSDGSVIKLTSSFGLDLIGIFVPPILVPPEELAKKVCRPFSWDVSDEVWGGGIDTTTMPIELSVVGGEPPYTWVATGELYDTSWYFDLPITQKRTNDFRVDAYACDQGVITVYDSCDPPQVLTALMWSHNGTWVWNDPYVLLAAVDSGGNFDYCVEPSGTGCDEMGIIYGYGYEVNYEGRRWLPHRPYCCEHGPGTLHWKASWQPQGEGWQSEDPARDEWQHPLGDPMEVWEHQFGSTYSCNCTGGYSGLGCFWLYMDVAVNLECP